MNKEEYKILKKAVLIEQEGFDFYMLAAARTEDEDTRAAFEKNSRRRTKAYKLVKRTL